MISHGLTMSFGFDMLTKTNKKIKVDDIWVCQPRHESGRDEADKEKNTRR